MKERSIVELPNPPSEYVRKMLKKHKITFIHGIYDRAYLPYKWNITKTIEGDKDNGANVYLIYNNKKQLFCKVINGWSIYGGGGVDYIFV